jgi:putative thioredoxin
VSFSEHISDVSEATFERDVILRSHEIPVVVDFWATWCMPCKVLSPLLERLTIEGGGLFRLAKVDVDQNPNLALRFGVRGIPAVKGFRNGQVVAEFVGAQPEPMVRRFIQGLAPTEADQELEKARAFLATHHWPDAEAGFREVLAREEASGPAAIGLAKSLLMQGKGGEALLILKAFPPSNEIVEAERLRPLAELLAEVEPDGPRPNGDPLQASLYQAGRLIARGNLPAAMDGLIDLLRQDKRYRGGLPKDVLLALFALLGDEDPLTRQYRDELASVLF